VIIKTYTKLCFYLYDLLEGQSGTMRLMYEFDKKYNTPLLKSLFIRCLSILTLFATSIFIFKERYNWKQLSVFSLLDLF
jgi:hypothetical protein